MSSRRFLPLVALFAVVTTAVAAATLGEQASWLGSWAETGKSLEDSTILTYPIVAAASAWAVATPRRRRFEWMTRTAVRHKIALTLASVGPIVGVAVAGHVVVAVIDLTLTQSQATFGHAPVLGQLVVLTGFLTSGAIGALLGSVLPPGLGSISALALTYGWSFVLSGDSPLIRELVGFSVWDPRERTYGELASSALLLKIAWLLCVACLCAVLVVGRRNAWLVPFGLACLVATPLMLQGSGGWSINEDALKTKCSVYSEQSLRVCMSAARAHEAANVAAAAEPVADLLSGLFPDGLVLREETLPSTSQPEPDSRGDMTIPFGVVNGIDGDAHQVDPRALQVQLVGRILRNGCAPTMNDAGQKPDATVADVIEEWVLSSLKIDAQAAGLFDLPLLGPNFLDYSTVAPFQEFWNGATTEQRETWLRTHARAVLTCSAQSDVLDG